MYLWLVFLAHSFLYYRHKQCGGWTKHEVSMKRAWPILRSRIFLSYFYSLFYSFFSSQSALLSLSLPFCALWKTLPSSFSKGAVRTSLLAHRFSFGSTVTVKWKSFFSSRLVRSSHAAWRQMSNFGWRWSWWIAFFSFSRVVIQCCHQETNSNRNFNLPHFLRSKLFKMFSRLFGR